MYQTENSGKKRFVISLTKKLTCMLENEASQKVGVVFVAGSDGPKNHVI